MLARSVLAADTADGVVRLSGARIGGQLSCGGATLYNNRNGPALHAGGLRVDGDVFLDKQFIANGAGELGAVRLLRGHITGVLNCCKAQVTNIKGPALDAERLQVDSNVYLDHDFMADGRGESAAFCLKDARVSGMLRFGEGESGLRNLTGPLVDLDGASVRRLLLPASAICQDTKDRTCQHYRAQARQIRVDGLTYTSRDPKGASLEQWLHWLRRHTPQKRNGELGPEQPSSGGASDDADPDKHRDPGAGEEVVTAGAASMSQSSSSPSSSSGRSVYSAQPYQQLAAVERAAGHDGAVRRILMAQRRDQLCRVRRDLAASLRQATGRTKGNVDGDLSVCA